MNFLWHCRNNYHYHILTWCLHSSLFLSNSHSSFKHWENIRHLFLSFIRSEAVSVLKTDNQASWSSSGQFLGLPIGRAGDVSLIFANISSYCLRSLDDVFVFLGFAEMKIKQTIQTRMHSSRMRTVCSSSRLSRGGMPQCMLAYQPPGADPPRTRHHPPDQNPPPWDQAPPEETPLWTDRYL